MKTSIEYVLGLSLLMTLAACGKPATDESTEVIHTASTPESKPVNEEELQASITSNNLAELRTVLTDNSTIDLNETRNGETPLITAIRSDAVEVRDFLLQQVDINRASSDDGETPLMAAARLNRLHSVQLLLDRKVKLDKKNHRGETALHIAIKNKHEKVALLLIENNANIDISDSNDKSVLRLAEEFGLGKVVASVRTKLQIAMGVVNESTFVALVQQGNVKDLEAMMAKYPELLISHQKTNPLMIAMMNNAGLEMVRFLLINNVPVDGTKGDVTPMFKAIHLKKLNFAELFLSYRARVNALDKEGHSALVHAVSANHLEAVELLLKYKAPIEYEYVLDGEEEDMDACAVAKQTGKALKGEAKNMNSAIKKAMDCSYGLFGWF